VSDNIRPEIILVEDDELLRYALEKFISSAGIMVSSFADAESALHAVEDGCPADLVVADLMLGQTKQHGLSLVQMIRMRRGEIPAVFITAFESLVVHAEAHGTVLLKPIDPAILVTEIRLRLQQPSP